MNESTLEPTPAMTVETPVEQRVETMTPEKRNELIKKSEEMRRLITDLEAQKAAAEAGKAQEEAKGAELQERINATLGTHKILDVIREEDTALAAIYGRLVGAANSELKLIETKLNAVTSTPEVSAPSSEQPVQETSKSLIPDLTQEASTAMNKPATVQQTLEPSQARNAA